MTNYDASAEEGEEHTYCNNCAGVENGILQWQLRLYGFKSCHFWVSFAAELVGIHLVGSESWREYGRRKRVWSMKRMMKFLQL